MGDLTGGGGGFPDVWGGGQLLAFSALDGPTDYSNGLAARTSFGGAGIDVLLPGRCRLKFAPESPATSVVGGDFIELETSRGSVRGAFLDCRHFLVEGPCSVEAEGGEVASATRGKRTLIGSARGFDVALAAADLDRALAERWGWLASVPVPGGMESGVRRAFSKALSILKGQVCSPEGNIRRRWTTPDRWPHRAMWLWDSAFHAAAWRHLDITVARDALEAVLETQRADGFIPHMAWPDGTSDITQPPVLALGVSLVDEKSPDDRWLAGVFPRLEAYLRWDMANRDSDGAGLVEWHIEGDPHCRSGESGMDNSPRFDSGERLDAVDFNSFLAMECDLLAGFAARLGKKEAAESWRADSSRLVRLINGRLWDGRTGFYHDCRADTGERTDILSSAGFLPLLCSAPGPARARRLADHLKNPSTFAAPLRVASVAASDPRRSKDMWRGPVWLNVNWLVCRGLRKWGFEGPAEELRSETVREVAERYLRHGSIFEFYDDRRETEPPRLPRKGACAPEAGPLHQVVFDYGWTAALFVDMVRQGA